jgi:Domain of unknown function (DUF4114)
MNISLDRDIAFAQQQSLLQQLSLNVVMSGGITPADLSQTFALNSLPSSQHTIYLDFHGGVIAGTQFNDLYGAESIVTPAYDLDGDVTFFSSLEKESIQLIWQRVAEDFSPFDVNVTTQAPTTTDDLVGGVRAVVGGDGGWFANGFGGVALINSFKDGDPVFVFSENRSVGSEKSVAEAISHELGHALGLHHDGQTFPKTEYYLGASGWASIMGDGAYQNLSQWSKGEYNFANEPQDDLGVIVGQNGFDYRSDDAGDSIETAKPLTISGVSVSGSGIIERNTDVDFYSFASSAGRVNLTINPASRGPNLDILAELYSSDGTLISSSNPVDKLSANISADLAAGRYYLKIDGVGRGDPLEGGYSDYGSLGQYFISGAVPPSIESFVLDLKRLDVLPSKVNFRVSREASYNNSVGFYTTLDMQGSIDTGEGILKPSDTGYTQAALRSAVVNSEKFGLDLSVNDRENKDFSIGLDSLFYMPIIASNNSLNTENYSSEVYTAFAIANSDKAEHIRLLGNNVFGFEDTMGGGDRDFNDLIVSYFL